MSFARYPAYKDSGVEWLGEVPEHWEVDRLKASITSARNGIWGNEAQGDDDDIPCVRVADFDRVALHVHLNEPTIRNVTAREREGRLLRRGNLLLEKSGGGENQPVGCVVLYDFDQPAVCSNFVARVQLAAKMDSSYWRYVHAAAYAVRLTVGSINQTSGIQNLDQDRYFNERAPFPPLEEQTAIATFLDRETAKIDALVAEQERLIALLKEKRQAVISHAVTKGLDPSVPMMDSGVEWLGKVPAHWLIRPIKHVGRLKGGAGFPHSEQGVEGEELCFYKVGSLGQSSSTGYLNESENTISRETASALGAFIFPKETLVFAKVGAALFLARVRALPADACLDNNMMGLVVDETKHAPAFVRYAMTLVRFDLIANPGAVPSLNEGQIGNFALAFPPSKAEQEAIAAFLDRATGQLEDLFAQAETVISTLRERRTALISAAVTGQIDVRGAPEQAP